MCSNVREKACAYSITSSASCLGPRRSRSQPAWAKRGRRGGKDELAHRQRIIVFDLRRKVPVAVEFPRKGLAANQFSGERFTRWSSVTASSFPFPSRTVEWLITTRPCTALKVRAASTSLPTLFPSSTGSRLSPSSSHQGPSMTWLRPVDRTSGTLTLSAGTLSCLVPSWNAPFEALPHDDRAGTHDSADGRCKAYASIGHGQAPTKICRRYPQGAACSPLEFRRERRAAGDGHPGRTA